jgi:uncharacterized repeat protein (TIGR01451 family)
MLNPQQSQPATYNKHGMTDLGTTTPPKKQKKSFGMRSILTVVGLSLFFIIAISGVLIAQRQSQVKEAVAPNTPASRPSAAEPAATTPVNACQKTFTVAFTPGTNTPQQYACNTDCTDDYQCKSATDGVNICHRPNAGTAESWTSWLNVTEAIPDNTSSGYITSFSSHTRPDKSIKQYVVRDGKLYVRTSDTNLNNWTGLIGPDSAIDGVGSGTLTSFSAFITPGTNLIQQHATKGGRIWSRTSPDDRNWSAWEDHTANVAGIGSGAVRSFTAFIMPDGSIKQYLVVGNELYVRSSNITRTTWGNFEGPNSALTGVGGGDITSLSAYTKPDKSIKQFAVIGGALYSRDNAGGKCRINTPELLEQANCKAEPTPGVASCQSKEAFTDFSTVTTATKLTSATPLKKGQEFVYRITVKGSTPEAKNVTITDTLPTGLTYVGPVGDSVIKHAAGVVTVTYPTVGAVPKVAEFKVKVATTVADGIDIVNKATIKTEGASPDECSVSLKVETTAVADYSCNKPCTTTAQCQDTTKGGNALYSCEGTTGAKTCRLTSNTTSTTCEAATVYACNTQCTDNSQCSAINADWVCASDQGNRCRLDTNRGSASCEAPPKTYTCNASCDNDEQCKSYNVSYKCYQAGGSTGKVCRLATNETNTSCNNPSAPPPAPAVGCNVTCSTTADCSNSNHICYDTALVGQTAGKVCRLANYVNSSSCTTPTGTSVAVTPPTTTKGGQPALPAELPQTGPEDWMNWLKGGLITLGVGAALLLLL